MSQNQKSPIYVFAPANPSYDKKFSYIAYGIVILILIFSTYLHHVHPQVLRVPNNMDVSSWQKPTFEQSTIYDRMTEEEKAKVLAEGIPQGDDLVAQFIGDLFTIAMCIICVIHARKYYGWWMASCFLIGSFVFTGLEETMWILFGRFMPQTLNAFGDPTYGTYWFTKGFFWFFETPIAACIGWFFIAYSCVLIAGKVFPKLNLWVRATVGGLIAMTIDLWVDPSITSPESMAWVWAKGDALVLFGIPHSNFVGWFLLIFLFAIFWEKLPLMEAKWGRKKATIYFFITIFLAELCILVFFILWLPLLGSFLKVLGVQHAIMVPAGW
jgi:hypothetical protein